MENNQDSDFDGRFYRMVEELLEIGDKLSKVKDLEWGLRKTPKGDKNHVTNLMEEFMSAAENMRLAGIRFRSAFNETTIAYKIDEIRGNMKRAELKTKPREVTELLSRLMNLHHSIVSQLDESEKKQIDPTVSNIIEILTDKDGNVNKLLATAAITSFLSFMVDEGLSPDDVEPGDGDVTVH